MPGHGKRDKQGYDNKSSNNIIDSKGAGDGGAEDRTYDCACVGSGDNAYAGAYGSADDRIYNYAYGSADAKGGPQ